MFLKIKDYHIAKDTLNTSSLIIIVAGNADAYEEK